MAAAPRRWKQRVALVFLSTLVTLMFAVTAAEVFLRLRRPYFTPDTMRRESLEYEATVIARHAFPRMRQQKVWDKGLASATINARGYRGDDFAVPKPRGLVRVVVLGGSSAFDTNATDRHDWPHLVQERLRARGLTHVEVINAGTPGHATWDSLGRLFSEIWMFEPDYVLVYHAWNDIKYFEWVRPDNSILRGYRPYGTAPGTGYVANRFIYYSSALDRWLSHSQFYVRLRQGQWRSRMQNIGPEGVVPARAAAEKHEQERRSVVAADAWGPRQYGLTLRLIADAARNAGAEPIFVTEARLATSSSHESDRKKIGINYSYANLGHEDLVAAFAACDVALKDAARAKNVSVLDLSARLTGRTDLFTDLVHTNRKGSEAFASATADFLEPILRGRTGRAN